MHEPEAVEWLMSEAEADKKSVRDWLYTLNPTRIINLFPLAGVRMHMFPSSFTDGYVLPKEGYATQTINSVPLLLMSSGDEFSSFVPMDAYFKRRNKANPNDPVLKAEMALAKRIGNRLYQYQNSGLIAQLLSDRYQSPIYVCRMDYGNEQSGVDKKFVERYGAVHGNVLPIITDQYKIPWKRGNDFFQHEGAIRLSELFLSCLYNFMCTGTPQSDEFPLEWSAWSSSDEEHSIVVFNADREQYQIHAEPLDFSYAQEFADLDADNTVSAEAKHAIITRVLAYRWFSEELDKHYHNPTPWYTR